MELTKEEKRQIGTPSAPRPELDIVAYRGGENLIRVIECKSYLDSSGVSKQAFMSGEKEAEGYKLFNKSEMRAVVFGRLVQQFLAQKLCPPNVTVKLGLASGKIYTAKDREWMHKHFDEQGWDLFDENWLRDGLRRMADQKYENQISVMVAKLLLRSI